MSVDFKVIFLTNDDNEIQITSTSKSVLTSGVFSLSQKVVHCLFTNVGDDIFYPTWGGGILDIFKTPIDPSFENGVKLAVNDSIRKAKSDIIDLQTKNFDKNISDDSLLQELELNNVYADTVNKTWVVEFTVISKIGTRLQISIP